MDEKEIVKAQCQIYGGDYKVLNYDSSSIRTDPQTVKQLYR